MLDAITIDGEMLKIPVAVHIDGMVYYNKKVAEAAGVDPTKWTSLDDMWADQKKVERRRLHLHRHRRQHLPGRLHLPSAARRRRRAGHLHRFYASGTPDKTVFDEPRLRDAIETFRKIADQTDEGWVNRAWNDTTNTVIAGTALMQIHGDWMKGVWRANNKKAGVDFGCINIPGTKALSVTVDCLRHPGRRRRGDAEGRGGVRLASSSIRRSTPSSPTSRARARSASTCRPTSSTPATRWCSTRWRSRTSASQNPFYIGDPDWINSVWNTMYTFQGDPSMTTDQAIEMLKSEYSAIF